MISKAAKKTEVKKRVEVKKKRTKYNTAHRPKDKNLKPVNVAVVVFEGQVELQFDRATRRVPMSIKMALRIADELQDKVELVDAQPNAMVAAEVGVEVAEGEDDDLGEVI